MDEDKLELITKRIGGMATGSFVPGERVPMLTLEEFFEGNEDDGSIGCNLEPSVQPSDFYEWLKAVRERSVVDNIYIQVVDCEPGRWPFSDKIWIVTSASIETIRDWIPEELRPDEIEAGIDNEYLEEIKIPENMQAVCLWYD